LRLPAELRVRILEYVFGQARYHVQASNQDGGHIPVFLFRCRFAVCHVGHSQRESPVKDDLSEPTTTDDNISLPSFGGEIVFRNHSDCYFEYQGRFVHWRNTDASQRMRRYQRGPLPTTLLSTCKQVHHDAASIFWRNNTFLMKFSKDDLQAFVGRMTIVQRKAVRSIALNFIDGPPLDRHSWQRSPTSYENLFILRAAERASYLSFMGLRRLELFISMEAGLTASGIHRSLDNADYNLRFKKAQNDRMHMWICWIRLLQRPDIEKIDVRVEAETENGTGSMRFGTSIQQRADWEQQVELIIRGKLGELNGKLNFPRSLSSDTASVIHRYMLAVSTARCDWSLHVSISDTTVWSSHRRSSSYACSLQKTTLGTPGRGSFEDGEKRQKGESGGFETKLQNVRRMFNLRYMCHSATGEKDVSRSTQGGRISKLHLPSIDNKVHKYRSATPALDQYRLTRARRLRVAVGRRLSSWCIS
jgi:hypothetical protein